MVQPGTPEGDISAGNLDKERAIPQPFALPNSLPKQVTLPLSEASELLESAKQGIRTAQTTSQLVQALTKLQNVEVLQSEAITAFTRYHQDVLSGVLQEYGARMDSIHHSIITNNQLTEDTKSSALARSALNLDQDNQRLTHIKQAIRQAQVQTKGLFKECQTISEAIQQHILDLTHSPDQADKLEPIQAFAYALMEAGSYVLTTCKNEIIRNHKDIVSAYNANKEERETSFTNSHFQGNHFHVPPHADYLLNESAIHLALAKAIDSTHGVTAPALLSLAERSLKACETSLASLTKPGIEDPTSAMQKAIKQLLDHTQKMQQAVYTQTGASPTIDTAITSVLHAAKTIETANNYAKSLHEEGQEDQPITSQQQRKMQKLLGETHQALKQAKRHVEAAMPVTGKPSQKPITRLIHQAKRFTAAVIQMVSALATPNKLDFKPGKTTPNLQTPSSGNVAIRAKTSGNISPVLNTDTANRILEGFDPTSLRQMPSSQLAATNENVSPSAYGKKPGSFISPS